MYRSPPLAVMASSTPSQPSPRFHLLTASPIFWPAPSVRIWLRSRTSCCSLEKLVTVITRVLVPISTRK